MDINLQWKSSCNAYKSNRYALHLKLTQCCQLYFNKTEKNQKNKKTFLEGKKKKKPGILDLTGEFYQTVKEEDKLSQKIEKKESFLKLFYKTSVSFLPKLGKDIIRKSNF